MRFFTYILVFSLIFIACNPASEKQNSSDKPTMVVTTIDTLDSHHTSTQKEKRYNEPDSTCNCKQYQYYNYGINCDPQVLKNGAKFFISANCDSFWYTIQNQRDEQFKISTLQSYQDDDYLSRIGRHLIQVYPKYILFSRRYIGGCCITPDYLLFSPKDGRLIRHTAEFLTISYLEEHDLLCYFQDTTLRTMEVMSLISGKTLKIDLSEYDIIHDVRFDGPNYPSMFFTDVYINSELLKLEFRTNQKIEIKINSIL
ncbi:hypothetical protein GYB22_01380 [bacterium]|nr:hypothetical protein [bacterium]